MSKYKIKATNAKGETTVSNIALPAEKAYELTSRFKEQLPNCKFEVIPTTETQ